ncbi:MAG: diguanylate cyclase [Synechococcales bacterium]|nr:diguanylate cyclase [Synechococcales bacterium]
MNQIPDLTTLDPCTLSLLPIGCAIFEPDGTCSYLNPAGERLLGEQATTFAEIRFYRSHLLPTHATPHPLRPISLAEVIQKSYPTDRLPFHQALQGITSQAEDWVILRSEQDIFLSIQASPLWNEARACYQAIATFQEITPQITTQVTLQAEVYKYRRLADNMPGSFQYTMAPGELGKLTYVSPNFYESYSIEADWLMADPANLWTIVAPETVEAMYNELMQSYQALTPWIHQGIFVTPRGKQWFQGYAMPEKFPNGNVVWHGFIIDITSQKQVELAYQTSESQLQCLAQTFMSASFCYFATLEGSYGFREMDAQIAQIYEVDRQVFLDDPDYIYTVAHPSDAEALQQLVEKTRANPQSLDMEYRIVTPVGQVKWTRVIAHHVLQPCGNSLWNGVILDVTDRKQVEQILRDYNANLDREVQERTTALKLEIQERKQAEARSRKAELALRCANAELERLASLDGLTQIANRRRFDEGLQQIWNMMLREGRSIAVILCDVDYFKRYNDTYGHPAGDSCLIQVAQTLQATVQRSGDLVARYGGEEFAIILHDTNLTGALQVAEKVQTAIANLALPHQASEVSDQVTLSLGVATIVPNSRNLPKHLLKMADQALYQAKQQGRNRIICHSPLAEVVPLPQPQPVFPQAR